MGGGISRFRSDYIITVLTGNKKKAGTDANVKIILIDEDGNSTKPISLDNKMKNDFESGHTDIFYVPKESQVRLGRIAQIELWRDNTGIGSDWFVDCIHVENKFLNLVFVFPILRWIKADIRYKIKHLGTSLPQHDEEKELRDMELKYKKEIYEYEQKAPGLPVQVKTLPEDDTFAFDYKWDIVKSKVTLKTKGKLVNLTSGKWKSLDDIQNVYDRTYFPQPSNVIGYKDDLYFAHQRLAGVNHSIIKLCTKIPEKLAVTEEMLAPFLQGNTLKYLLDYKRIFICDLEILDQMEWKEGYVVCAPIALFMVDNSNNLRPIAIQLNQQPGEDNPVFLPSDDPNLWILAKMWYNNADCTHHQALTHLGFTHLLVEGMAIAVNRNISQLHPVYKLLAPHFHYLIAINDRALGFLISPGGWVDKSMNNGAQGLIRLVGKGIDQWRLNVHGNLYEDLKQRGVDEEDVLPGYYFRDDAKLLYDAIYKYVLSYIELYYTSDEMVVGDWEIQNFGKELNLPRDQGGVGILGLPNDGVFKTKSDIALVATSIIYISSVMHAAANFQQYDQYAFPPNYPATMKGTPPKTKDPIDEKSILETLADKTVTIDIMIVTKILSQKGTQSLGNFEQQYIYDPKALELVNEFRNDLKTASETIIERNMKRKIPYDYLDPVAIPNAISI